MEPITATIAKEVVAKIADKATENALKYTVNKIEDATRPKTENPVVSICERLSSEVKAETLSDAA